MNARRGRLLAVWTMAGAGGLLAVSALAAGQQGGAPARDAQGARAPVVQGTRDTSSTSRNDQSAYSAEAIIFDRLDANHDKRLSRSELQHDRHAAAMLRELDRNHDGTLSRDEFSSYQPGTR